MTVPSRVILRGMFSEPTVFSTLNSDTVWSRGAMSPLFQKSTTGWLANLYGGVQSGDDFASVPVEVDELRIPDFADKADTTQWTYYLTNAEVYGINMVIWAHDPNDPSKRVEITQAPSHADLAKASGWNKHILNKATTQFFYYGENVSGSGLTAGTQYTWTQFQEDVVFVGWTIYRISFEYGWYSTGTFEDAWVADIKLNGAIIPLKPDRGGTGRIGRRFYTASSALAGTLAPKTPFELLSIIVHTSAVLDTGEALTLTLDAGQGAFYDAVILNEDLFIGSRTSMFATFEKAYFGADDEIDLAQANGSSDDIGVVLAYQTVFG